MAEEREDHTPASREFLEERNRKNLESYQANPDLIEEHALQELASSHGAYGKRQLFELIQNAADATVGSGGLGRVHVVLTDEALYCANTGSPLTEKGLRAILHAYLSDKKDDERIGRFGLGFKSVLAISHKPQIFSGNFACEFDPNWAESQIRSHVPHYRKSVFPTLRLAKPIELDETISSDPVLRELRGWAVTIIKVPFKEVGHDWLAKDMQGFPEAFLLFCPDVEKLILDDRTSGTPKIPAEFSRSGESPITIASGKNSSSWFVFSTKHEPSDVAKKDGGPFAGRDSIEISWAVPAVAGSSSSGQFWAYFPLDKEKMSLKGILNAGWKLNEDRQNIQADSLFNGELFETAAELALGNLRILMDESDPGKLMELLPGRLDERQDADLPFTIAFYDRAGAFETLPDATGWLTKPRDLRIPVSLMQFGKDASLWLETERIPDGWIHPSAVNTTTRSARVDQLLVSAGLDSGSRASIRDWIEALVSEFDIDDDWELDKKAAASAAAVRLATSLFRDRMPGTGEAVSRGSVFEEVAGSEIVLTADGRFVSFGNKNVFLPGNSGLDVTGINVVHPDLASDETLLECFEILGIKPVEATSELESLVASRGLEDFSDAEWTRLWEIVDRVESGADTRGRSASIIKDACEGKGKHPRDVVRVKTGGSRFELIRDVLVPGVVIEGEEDAVKFPSIAVDLKFHSYENVITDLGAVKTPQAGGGSLMEDWFERYRRYAFDKFIDGQSNEKTPQENRLTFNRPSFFGPISPLTKLSGKTASIFTSRLIASHGLWEEWSVSHSQPSYITVKVESPVLWAVRSYGAFETALGVRRADQLLGSTFSAQSGYLPVFEGGDSSLESALKLPQTRQEISPSLIDSMLRDVQQLKGVMKVGALYAFVSQLRQAPPTRLWAQCGEEMGWYPIEDVVIGIAAAMNEQIVSILKDVEHPFLLVESAQDSDRLKGAWGIRGSESIISFETKVVQNGAPESVAEKFPGLAHLLSFEDQDLLLVPCSSIRKETSSANGIAVKDFELLLERPNLYYRDNLAVRDLLEGVVDELDVGLTVAEIEDILSVGEDEAYRKKLSEIREVPDIPLKLLQLVGSEVLKRWLKPQLLETVASKGVEINNREIAKLFSSVYGVSALEKLKDDLEAAGFRPPKQWVGGSKTRLYVKDLGFPIQYAGFEAADRSEFTDVQGPLSLPDLHPFQRVAVTNVKEFFLARERQKRGLLSLPTGAGKTRVAVQSICEALREGSLEGPVIWVAQTDELCEQAVQSWLEVWRSEGAPINLRVCRLWSTNDADSYQDGAQVVVATIDKLERIITAATATKADDYLWLTGCCLLVIDEAHLALAESYNKLINWVNGVDGAGAAPGVEDRGHILGLTATPFRANEDQSNRLARRFGTNRLDGGVFPQEDAYGYLQENGFLANVEHRLLEGIDVQMSESEREEWKRRNQLPATVVQRLSEDRERNEQILDAIRSLQSGASVLVFAASVENAEILAASLVYEGVSAVSVSADTKPGIRRHYIEEFRAGRIKVIANYNVLTTGFDAPATNAIIVARPTFSASRYQQMIGRGLRGIKNGGKESCVIVNVKDNFEAYGETLAFNHFDYLWRRR